VGTDPLRLRWSATCGDASTHSARPWVLCKQGTRPGASYIYDGIGRRVVRTIGNSTSNPAYDRWNLVQRRAANGNSVTANYLTGIGLDQPLLRTVGPSTSFNPIDRSRPTMASAADRVGIHP
jgi:hypothetical protein